MIKKISFLCLLFFGIIFGLVAHAEERIDNFDTTIQINHDSSINIEEKIQYNFDNLEKYGIYRNIPIHYQARGGNFSLGISDISVADENNHPYQFSLANQGNDKSIKIGDSNQLISGIKTYVIRYKIERAINYFQNHDELYWNATGNEWEIPIMQSSAKIILPQSVSVPDLQADCFVGLLGYNEKCASFWNLDSNNQKIEGEVDQAQIVNFVQGSLGAGEGLTIVVGFPKGIVIEPTVLQKSSNIVWDNKIVFLPILVFIVYFIIWWKKGRDPKGKGVIVPQYEAPDNLTPIEVGTLLDYRIDNRDLSAEIIDLAIKGYLKITQVEKKTLIFKSKDYLLEALKDADELENEFDQKLMAALFEDADIEEKDGKKIKTVKLSDIDKTIFQVNLISIKNKVNKALFDKGYVADKPKRKFFTGIKTASILMPFIWFIMIVFMTSQSGIINILSIGSAVVIFVIFTILMRKRTQKGVITREEILGLREYIRVAEIDRIKFHDAPEKNPQLFEKLLPYAMVFGLEKEWAKQFKDIYINPPNWYQGPMGSSFNSLVFISSLNSFTASAGSAIISPSRGAAGGGSGFGGGGFSGGGGGGGGGGSW